MSHHRSSRGNGSRRPGTSSSSSSNNSTFSRTSGGRGNPSDDCDTCHGHGTYTGTEVRRAPGPCRQCNGRGWCPPARRVLGNAHTAKRRAACAFCNRDPRCRYCSGSGEYTESSCVPCGGTGTVVQPREVTVTLTCDCRWR
jgi:DnaJ-class molecular chaperone